MKKLLLSTLIVLAVAGINNLNAQCMSQPTITWTGDCVYPDNKAVYAVNMTIWNECVTPTQKIVDFSDAVSTSITSYTFCIPENICTNDQKEKCFKLIYTVAKVNIDTYEIECRDQEVFYLNCEELHSAPEPSIVLVY